jgi:hypothetical protein
MEFAGSFEVPSRREVWEVSRVFQLRSQEAKPLCYLIGPSIA